LQARGDDVGRLADDLFATLPAVRATDAGPEQPQVIVNLGGGADGRAGIADAVLLTDGDGRRNAVDTVDVRLLHALEELARVGRQRLDVPPLPLGVDGVEGQRGLAGPADPREDDQRARGQRQVDILEVVRTGAADDKWLHCGRFSAVSEPTMVLQRPRPRQPERIAPGAGLCYHRAEFAKPSSAFIPKPVTTIEVCLSDALFPSRSVTGRGLATCGLRPGVNPKG